MKVIKVLIVLILILAGLTAAFQEQIMNNTMRTVIKDRMSASAVDQFEDTLTVAICGAGSPLPDPERSGSCAAVIAGDQMILIDAGSVNRVNQMNLPLGSVDNVFLTHYHSDHIDGLGGVMTMRWAASGNANPINVFGPAGLEDVVSGFNQAYQYDRVYREAHHTTTIMPPTGGLAVAHTFEPDAQGKVVFENDGLKVIMFPVNHEPVEPAVGYRVEYKGRSIVFSGDTEKSPMVEKFAQGADVLVHEALNRDMVNLMTDVAKELNNKRIAKITFDITDYHTSPVEAAEIAAAAGVPFLLFSHIVPQLPVKPAQMMFTRGVDDVYSGEFAIAKDGTYVSIHLEDGSISQGDLL